MLNLFIADVKEEFYPAFITSDIKGTFGWKCTRLM